MARIYINSRGTKTYFDEEGFRHREDGPATIWKDGSFAWFYSHKLHRTDGPAYITGYGSITWRQYGKIRRSDGPSWDNPNGFKRWYKDNVILWPKL